MADAATALLALWNDVDPALEADYDDWHAREHVPERLTVPGMAWALRYRWIAGAAMPRYLTLYGLRDPAVLDGEPYQRLLREPTPASRRMLSPSTPSRSASRTASTTTRCLLSPASEATWRCSFADTGLLARSNRLTIVQRTRIVRCTTYGVRTGR